MGKLSNWVVAIGTAALTFPLGAGLNQLQHKKKEQKDNTEAAAKTHEEQLAARDTTIARQGRQLAALTAEMQADSIGRAEKPEFAIVNDSTIVVGQDTIPLKGKIKVPPRGGGLSR